MKITAQTEAVSSPPEEKWHWSQQWRQNTFRAGQKLKADWKKDLHNLGAGRKSRKPPTPFVGMKPNGKSQITRTQQNIAEYNAGVRNFQFDATIYGHDEVKQALVNMHHGKCCYCESKVRHTGPGTIDHYRPRAASQQHIGTAFIRPGYYWLVYSWENLLFSCIACNQTHKRNLFPLRDDARRALSHAHPINQEEPLLIDPSNENPSDFISFREEYAFALNGNLRGRVTIEVLALNDRNDLVGQRREKIRILRLIQNVITLMPQSQEAADAQLYLDEAVMDTAEYASMCRAFLQ